MKNPGKFVISDTEGVLAGCECRCGCCQVLQHMEDVKMREMQIFDYKKKIAEAETKLKQQQILYEAVRSDRNLYSKNLIESQVRAVTSAVHTPSSSQFRRHHPFLTL